MDVSEPDGEGEAGLYIQHPATEVIEDGAAQLVSTEDGEVASPAMVEERLPAPAVDKPWWILRAERINQGRKS